MPVPITRLLAGLLLLTAALPGHAGRELAGDPAEFAEAELVTVGVSPGNGVPLALLRTIESRELVPIFIGPFEARAIQLALQGIATPRPMTHDLMGELLAATDTELERLLIDDLVDGTFLGMLELRSGGSMRRVDTRPSDGLALAVRTGAAIFIAPRVVSASRGQPWEGLPGQQVVRILGITVIELSAEVRAALELPDVEGVLVSQATGAAGRAGISAGDLILAINDQPVSNPLKLLEILADVPEDATLRLRLWQDGEVRELELKAGDEADAPELRVQKLPAGVEVNLFATTFAPTHEFKAIRSALGRE